MNKGRGKKKAAQPPQKQEEDDHEEVDEEEVESEDMTSDEEEDEVDDEEVASTSGGGGRQNPFFNKKKDKEEEEEEEEDSSEFEDFEDSDEEDDDEGEEEEEEQGGEEDGQEEDGEDDEDDLIKKLKKSKEKAERTSPPDIKLRDLLVDISMHPGRDIVAASTMDGDIKLFSYSIEGNKLLKALAIHKKDARSIEFDHDGGRLYSGSLDRSVKAVDVETSKVCAKIPRAHPSPLYRVKPLGEHLLATGDEDGGVRLWDNRVGFDSPAVDLKPFDDFVSDFHADDDLRHLVASSGEGLLQSFNLRGRRADVQSEVYEGEMNCLERVRRGSKMVAGCGDGSMYLFNWGQFAYHSDQFPGHPDAVNDMVAVTDNIVLTACEDGAVRAVHLYPHRFVGTVGHHRGGFGVERLDVNGTGETVASVSHDHRVKFWNIQYLESMDYNKTKKPFNNRNKKYKVRRKENKMNLAKEKEHQLPSSNKTNSKDFFSDL